MYRKFGFGRGCQQISVDVRTGRMERANALAWVEAHDGLFPHVYAGVPIDNMLDRISVSRKRLTDLLDKFSGRAL
jgi:hypothetical protein